MVHLLFQKMYYITMFIDIVIQNNINHDRGQRTTNLLLFKDAVNIKKVCILNYSKKKH